MVNNLQLNTLIASETPKTRLSLDVFKEKAIGDDVTLDRVGGMAAEECTGTLMSGPLTITILTIFLPNDDCH